MCRHRMEFARSAMSAADEYVRIGEGRRRPGSTASAEVKLSIVRCACRSSCRRPYYAPVPAFREVLDEANAALHSVVVRLLLGNVNVINLMIDRLSPRSPSLLGEVTVSSTKYTKQRACVCRNIEALLLDDWKELQQEVETRTAEDRSFSTRSAISYPRTNAARANHLQ